MFSIQVVHVAWFSVFLPSVGRVQELEDMCRRPSFPREVWRSHSPYIVIGRLCGGEEEPGIQLLSLALFIYILGTGMCGICSKHAIACCRFTISQSGPTLKQNVMVLKIYQSSTVVMFCQLLFCISLFEQGTMFLCTGFKPRFSYPCNVLALDYMVLLSTCRGTIRN